MKYPKQDKVCRVVADSELHTVDLALKHVKKFDVCVQAGGNVGYWPKYLAKKFKTVHTFEPDLENYLCLCHNLCANNIIIERAALGGTFSRGSIVGDPTNCGAYQVEDGDDFDIITIDSLKLDALDFLCLDIEGMELSAIKGGLNTIRMFSPVIMVEDKGCSERYGSKIGDVGNFLQLFDYEIAKQLPRDVIFVRS